MLLIERGGGGSLHIFSPLSEQANGKMLFCNQNTLDRATIFM